MRGPETRAQRGGAGSGDPRTSHPVRRQRPSAVAVGSGLNGRPSGSANSRCGTVSGPCHVGRPKVSGYAGSTFFGDLRSGVVRGQETRAQRGGAWCGVRRPAHNAVGRGAWSGDPRTTHETRAQRVGCQRPARRRRWLRVKRARSLVVARSGDRATWADRRSPVTPDRPLGDLRSGAVRGQETRAQLGRNLQSFVAFVSFAVIFRISLLRVLHGGPRSRGFHRIARHSGRPARSKRFRRRSESRTVGNRPAAVRRTGAG